MSESMVASWLVLAAASVPTALLLRALLRDALSRVLRAAGSSPTATPRETLAAPLPTAKSRGAAS